LHAEELGIKMVPFKMMVYLEDHDKYVPQDEVTDGDPVRKNLSSELKY
jgi:ATP sulfurylase